MSTFTLFLAGGAAGALGGLAVLGMAVFVEWRCSR